MEREETQDTGEARWVGGHSHMMVTPVRYVLRCEATGCADERLHKGYHSNKEEALLEARTHASRRGHRVLVEELRPAK